MFQVINKLTNEVVREHIAYAPLEAEYADSADLYFLKNADTGVEWEIESGMNDAIED